MTRHRISRLVRSRQLLAGVGLLLVLGTAWAARPQHESREKPKAAAEQAQQRAEKPNQRAAEQLSSQVPLKRVVMFTSGVSYFEHAAEIEEEAQLQLTMPPDDVNDLLKSLVIEDPGGGHISAVHYESQAPIARVLDTFAVDLSQNISLPDLIGQIRGQQVRVEGDTQTEGIVVSVTTRQRPVVGPNGTQHTVPVQILNLRTKEGLRSIPFENISTITLADPELDRELGKALDVLARDSHTEQKAVTMKFNAAEQRQVRVGYIQKTPVWKMTYRLVLRNDDDLLQGWAIVENQTGQEWHHVNLALVSGQPISYVMPLYDPLYVDRPKIQLDLYEQLRPQTYGQDITEKEAQLAAKPQDALRRAAAPRAEAAARAGGPAANTKAAKADRDKFADGLRSVAEAGEVGELFQYEVKRPVTLARHESAMLPVISQTLRAEKLSIFDHSAHEKHPFNGARLNNTTDLYLMKGPITVYEEGSYAGDAILESLQPGADRLITYALDTEVEVATNSSSHPQRILSLNMVGGTLHIKYRLSEEQTYTAKNRGDEPRELLIVHPKRGNWQLVAPEDPAATTAEAYRFALSVQPGESEKLLVKQEHVVSETIAFTNLSDDAIVRYLHAQEISDVTKRKLREVVDRKQQVDQLQAQIDRKKQELNQIDKEQQRIRQNMQQLEKTTDLYQRYVEKLSGQEDRIETLNQEIHKLQDQMEERRQELNEYLSGLQLEAAAEK